MKILLVDDDPLALKVQARLLQRQGHEVLEANDGELAWRMLRENPISCVVSDWMMPNLAGVDLCRRIRSADLGYYVYVILCTARDEKSDLIAGLDAGADDFLVKPISPEELRVKVRVGERILTLQHGLAEKNRELAGANRRLQTAQDFIEDDLKAAAWMQERLLPPSSLRAQGVGCESLMQPAGYVGGDIFNFFPLDDHHLGFYLLDVSGHGVPAAMLSVALNMMLTPDAAHGSPLKRFDPLTGLFAVSPPCEVIRELNFRFQSKDDRYFTMIYGLLDTRSHVLSLAQAGHPGPILLKKDGTLESLGSGGMPVGLWPDIHFDCFDVPFHPGDRLLVYSDGVTECPNPVGEIFGNARLAQYMRQGTAEPLDTFLGGLLAEIQGWREAPDFDDDVSLLALEMF